MDQSGSGQWQPHRSGMNLEPMRAPKTTTQINAGVSLSPTAAPFFPRQYSNVPQQQHPQHHQEHRNRGDNSGAGGGGGGGGSYSIHPRVSQYQTHQHDVGNNGTMVNGTDAIVKSSVSDRLKQVSISDSGSQPQQPHQPPVGQYSYNDNKDIRNSSHYNHHHHHANQHYPQHSQQHRLQNQHHHQSHHQQQGQQQHMPLHQNHQFAMAGMGYSSTALNNHLHHPILGGIAAVANASGPSMMAHENKYNSSGRSRSHNSQNLQMHHHQDNHHHHHHQQSHQYHQQMQQHHPGNCGGGNNGYGGGNSNSDQVTEDETSALDYLTEVIAELYDNPGMFENIQRKLKNTFVEFRHNGFVIANAVELVFEQSIKEQNFRYMGARLMQLLDSLDNGPNSTIREALQQKMDHQHGELHTFMQSEQIKVRGTILFLAELYMQLRSTDNDRNKSIAMRIINTAHILLKKEGPENIKCVCQCLKLCGFELEKDCREELLQILEILRSMEPHNNCSTGRLIRSVLDLQEKSWGRNEEVVPIVQQAAHSESAYDDFNGSPVFYGPDGEELTEEENNFLEMAAPSISFDLDGDEDADELVDDENMDPEIKIAFKDFVASSRNQQTPY